MSSSLVFSHMAEMPADRSSCVDELSSLGGRLFGILRWSVSPFHVVSVVGTARAGSWSLRALRLKRLRAPRTFAIWSLLANVTS